MRKPVTCVFISILSSFVGVFSSQAHSGSILLRPVFSRAVRLDAVMIKMIVILISHCPRLCDRAGLSDVFINFKVMRQ